MNTNKKISENRFVVVNLEKNATKEDVIDTLQDAIDRIKESRHLEKDFTKINFLVYKFLEMNNFTFGDLLSHDSCTDFIHSMNYFVPKIMLGRQKGHTTTLKEFIKDNPDLNFLIFTYNRLNFNETFKDVKNAFYYKDYKDYKDYKGLKVDYIIFEECGTIGFKNYTNRDLNGVDLCTFMSKLQVTKDHQIRIAAIGN